MRFLRKISRYFTIKEEERILFRQALFLLIGWKMKIVFLPMKKYVMFFGVKGNEYLNEDDSKDDLLIRIPIAIRRADSILPWRSKCLTEAIATKRLLAKYNIRSTLFLGVAKDENQKLIAHAWLRCGPRIISGEAGHQKFTIVQKFS
jgi:hypothetical protein